MRTLCQSQLNFLENLEGMKLEDIPTADSAEPAPEHAFAETVRNVESSAARMGNAVDAGREISRVVSDASAAPAIDSGTEEPTRLYSSASGTAAPAAAPEGATGQFSFENLHFGK